MESNKLIADFMELPKVPCSIAAYGYFTEGYKHPKVATPTTPSDMQYKYSWAWLMPVVQKCLDISNDSEMIKDFYSIQNVVPIDVIYQAIVEFIKEYNNRTDGRKQINSGVYGYATN